jgi:hypothetical protein
MPRWNNLGPTERRKSNGKRKSMKMRYWLGHGTGCYSNTGDESSSSPPLFFILLLALHFMNHNHRAGARAEPALRLGSARLKLQPRLDGFGPIAHHHRELEAEMPLWLPLAALHHINLWWLTFDIIPVSARSPLEIPSTEPRTADSGAALRVYRGLEKRSAPSELAFASRTWSIDAALTTTCSASPY